MVASADRLSRFNLEFFEWLFQYFGCKLICLNKKRFQSAEQELSEDIMSIITVFTARYYGKRKYNGYKKKKIRFFPTKEQKDFFGKCFGVTRFIYNTCLWSIKELYKLASRDLRKKAEKTGCIHMIKIKKAQVKNGSKKIE